MKEYGSKISFLNSKKSGFAMVVVMSFMLTSAMLGGSVVYMANKQSETTAGVFAKKTAVEAANSAGQWFTGAIEDYSGESNANKIKLIEWLNNFDQTTNSKWYNGSSDIVASFTIPDEINSSTINISDKSINAKVKIESYDIANQVITIKTIGYGINESKKTMHYVYKLEGVMEKTVGGPFNGAYIMYGFSAGKGLFSDKSFNVLNSGAYIGDDPSTSSVMHMGAHVEGDVKIMNQKSITIDKDFVFGGNLYVDGDIVFNQTGDFGSDSAEHIFINGSALFNQSINFNTKSYFMDISSNIGQNLTFNEYAYIKDNGAAWNKTTYFNSDADIYAAGDVSHNGKPSFVVASGGELDISTQIQAQYMRDRVSGTLNENVSSMNDLEKEDVLMVSDYSTHEEIDIDYQKMRDVVDDENKGVRLTKLSDLPSGWDRDGDGKLDAADVNYIYENNLLPKNSSGVLTIIADDNDKIDFADNSNGTLAAGVQVAMVVDDENLGYKYGSDWNMWKTTMQPTSEESTNENSASLGVFVSEQGSLFESHMIVEDLRGMIHDEYNGMYFNKDINMQGAFIAKQHLESKNDISIDYENDVIGTFFDMGIFLDPATHNAYEPPGSDENTATDSSTQVIYKSSVKPVKLFEY